MPKLVAHTGHSFDIPSHGVTFGTDQANDVMIPSLYGLAPRHFAILNENFAFVIRDSGSGIGVLVNGSVVHEARLQHGDAIEVGNLKLIFQDAAPAAIPDWSGSVPSQQQAPPLTPERPNPVAPAPQNISWSAQPKAVAAVQAWQSNSGTLTLPLSALQAPAAPGALPPRALSPQASPPPNPHEAAWFKPRTAAPAGFAQTEIVGNKIQSDLVLSSPPPPEAPPIQQIAAPLLPPAPLQSAPILPVWNPTVVQSSAPAVSPVPTEIPTEIPPRLPAFSKPEPRQPQPTPRALPPTPVVALAVAHPPYPPLLESAPQPVVQDVQFEVLPAEPTVATVAAEPPPLPVKGPAVQAPFPPIEAPPWLPKEDQASPAILNAPSKDEPLSGVSKRRVRKAHREKVTGNHLLRAAKYAFLAALLGAAGSARYWGQGVSGWMESTFSSVGTPKSGSEPKKDLPPEGPEVNPHLIENQRQEVLSTPVDTSKPHVEVAPRFIWDGATTVFSLGFPQIEIFYLNQAQQRGLPMPKRHCAYVEKHFGLKIEGLQRLTSIQVDADKPGLVVMTTQRDANASDWISEANLQEENPQSVGPLQVLQYIAPDGHACGVVAIDQRNFVIGDPSLITACLLQKTDSKTSAHASALWPDFLRKQPGAFLWTVKVDAAMQAELNKSSKTNGLETISSFAVRFGGEPPTCEGFAIRDASASQEAFANAATSSLRGMLRMMTTQIEAGGTQRSGPREEVPVDVSRTAATAQVRRGEEFVNIFLQGFYAPVASDTSPLATLAQARTIAHAFNLARGFDAPEARKVRTVEQAMEALQHGMSGTGRAAAMEFQIQEMNRDEMQRMRKYLTFADGYLACRPDLDSLPDHIRALTEEGRDRMNAETVLSLCAAPSSEKAVKIKDLTTFIRKSLADLRATKGAMALFGMPQLTEEEVAGVLRYIHQKPNGQLGWKQGEVSYNAWEAKANPKAERDAAALARIAGAAQAAGVDQLKAATSVEKAIEILCQGVQGTGQFGSTVFKCQSLTPQEMQAAAELLVLDNGALRLKSESGN